MRNSKTSTTIIAIAIGLAVGIGTAQAAEPRTAPAEPITITGKKPVTFTHATHLALAIACAECHHDGQHVPLTSDAIAALADDGVLQCASCHNDTFAKPELRSRKTIFHNNCKTCHEAGLNNKKGPTNCSGCHRKSPKKAVEGC
jgi:hypothetical protein